MKHYNYVTIIFLVLKLSTNILFIETDESNLILKTFSTFKNFAINISDTFALFGISLLLHRRIKLCSQINSVHDSRPFKERLDDSIKILSIVQLVPRNLFQMYPEIEELDQNELFTRFEPNARFHNYFFENDLDVKVVTQEYQNKYNSNFECEDIESLKSLLNEETPNLTLSILSTVDLFVFDVWFEHRSLEIGKFNSFLFILIIFKFKQWILLKTISIICVNPVQQLHQSEFRKSLSMIWHVLER